MASSSQPSSISRLDQVFTLLENGASSVARKAAAKQLGDVQKKHPHELNNLFAKLLPYICHHEWDARIAAAEAVESIINQIPVWDPTPAVKQEPSDCIFPDGDRLTFEKFDIDKLLAHSQLLLGSSGNEYKLPPEMEGLDAQERVKRQRKMIEKRIGLTMAGSQSLGVSSDDLFNDEDLVVKAEEVPERWLESEKKSKPVNPSVVLQLDKNMSSRERNRAKRKAKLLMKQVSKEVPMHTEGKNSDGQPAKKRRKGETAMNVHNKNLIQCEDVPKHDPSPDDWTSWPFNWISDELINLLFNPSWENRHGACLALRNIMKKHGKGSGRHRNMDKQQLTESNQSWLVDLAIRLLCVISLDRFADFVSDQVVAPVRESCAQTLSVVVAILHEKHVFDVIKLLLYLLSKDEWEVRQSAMLSIQYIVAVRQDLQSGILDICFPSILKGLHDSDGDVRNVSAKALLPTTDLLYSNAKYERELNALLSMLWNGLKEYDELTASTQSVLLLLSKLIRVVSFDKICQSKKPQNLLTYLWPFFHHALGSVREASLLTVLTFLNDEKDRKLTWLSTICLDGLWNIFQCCLLEPNQNIRSLSMEVFISFVRKCPCESLLLCAYHVPKWLDLVCQPTLVPYDAASLIDVNHITNPANLNAKMSKNDQQKMIGGIISTSQVDGDIEEYIMKSRECVARMIGIFCCHYLHSIPENSSPDSPAAMIKTHLLFFLSSQLAIKRIIAALVITNWWEETLHFALPFPSSVSAEIHCALYKVQSEYLYFSEITTKFCQIQSDIKSLLNSISMSGVNTQMISTKAVYSFDEVLDICVKQFPQIVPRSSKGLMEQRNLLLKLTETAQSMQTSLDRQVKSYAAAAIVGAAQCVKNQHELWKLPVKLNPIIRPLMDSIKKEQNFVVRCSISTAVARLLGLCADRVPCPNVKLIRNLCNFLTSSSVHCPRPDDLKNEFSDEALKACALPRERIKTDGLLTQLRRTEESLIEISKKKRGGEKMDNSDKTVCTTGFKGAQQCLQAICEMYQCNFMDMVPYLWEMVSLLQNSNISNTIDISNEDVDNILKSLITFQVIIPVISEENLQKKIFGLLTNIISLSWSNSSCLRFLSARCIAVVAKHMPDKAMPIVVDQVLCNLDITKDIYKRKGSIETIANIITEMGMAVVSYTILLIVPLLGCMSDHDTQIRLLSTHCFAQLIQFIPVEASIPDALNMPENLIDRKKKDRRFLEQLLNSQSLESYEVPVRIKATLRSYQKDGVKWLAFLNRYKLHGVLCDEMGLGKTLQTICIIASDHYYKMKKHKEENPVENMKLTSLVVCPPTLTGHWVEEIRKFCDDLDPLQYAGNPQERARLQGEVKKHNIVVASYEVVRNDITFFSKIKWNYYVLDEGHAIRNGKSKTSQRIKSLFSNHRLILTGTPIQNSVLELWSLFDFLIPGFLGSEQEFNLRYTKPILASRDAKSSSKEQENGLLAMEALHRQVLPFMLRRMKEDVLQDLPPKIIQDYYCDLSPLQLQLYEDFAKSRAKKNAESSINTIDADKDQKSRMKGASHVFQALQYLQKVCNHPLFVVTPNHPQFKPILGQLKNANTSLHDIKHATKLTALRQLLLDCGIGVTGDSFAEQSVVNQHRALIFCQHKNLLDIIENDLLTALMPSVTFLRLDGGIPANQRFSIVSRFNNDPSIDILLLTTKVGGLGLNLTGADTVIFVEHDWNPMVDLQAMDRAHRIGQKKVVNVYRLITRGTLEEKILGLQKFKLSIANTVVGDDNRGLQSMGTNQVLGLFTLDKSTTSKAKSSSEASSRGLRSMMEGLEELWDQSQYDEEYNLDNFIQKLSDK
ncbi:TATA-binding protein-associated factor 172-like [Clavelina lepadiformis]|uniref:TATA-binding protein-associated factor 172-like n=1 Tax=Clavelina lepadiformis TaxID=159417 RepID=UPI004040FA16